MKDRGEEGPSKSRRKREATALQSLGEALAELPAAALDSLQLPDRLRQALDELGRISAHEARRRQKQFIGKLMRDVDPAPLEAFLEARRRPSREAARLFRRAEDWRDRLLDEGEPAVQAFLQAHPEADAEALATIAVAAWEGRSGAARKLFRLVKAEVDRVATRNNPSGGPALLE